jgi:predicted secreted protein
MKLSGYSLKGGSIMRITSKTIMAAISVLFMHSACSMAFACDQGAGGGHTVIIRKEQNGLELRVRPGDIIRVELPTSGGTGYAWFIDLPDSRLVELISEETKTDTEKGKVGAPVTSVWLFRAGKEGWSEIKLDYYRKWEGKEKSADHFFIKVHITGSAK